MKTLYGIWFSLLNELSAKRMADITALSEIALLWSEAMDADVNDGNGSKSIKNYRPLIEYQLAPHNSSLTMYIYPLMGIRGQALCLTHSSILSAG